MAEGNKIRLIKIASEINIGRETIVEYLKTKGHEIDNKPTATLSDEMVEIIYDKFKREKKAAEKQREKIQKHKEIRKTSDPKARTSIDEGHGDEHKADSFETVEHTEAREFEVVEIKVASVPEAPAQVHAEPHSEEHGPAVGTVISLGKKPEMKKQDEPQRPEPIKVEENKTPLQATSATKPEATTEKQETAKPELTNAPKQETKPTHSGQSPKQEFRSDNQHHKKEHQPNANRGNRDDSRRDEQNQQRGENRSEHRNENRNENRSEQRHDNRNENRSDNRHEPRGEQRNENRSEPRSENRTDNRSENRFDNRATQSQSQERQEQFNEDGTPRKERESRRRRKKKKLIEVVEPGASPKLSGLKILGKIDINKEKPAPSQNDRNRFAKKRIPLKTDNPVIEDSDAQDKPKFKKKLKDKIVPVTPVVEEKGGKLKDRKEDKKRKKKKKSIRESITQEEVSRAIRETYAGMEYHGGSMRAKIRQKKKTEREEKELRQSEERERESHILRLTEFVTTADLANLMNTPANEIILKCMSLGLMVTINQRLDKDTIILIADDYGFEIEFIDQQKVVLVEDDTDDEADLKPRSPIVTIMGHVDHGKTSLLDYIRHSNVVAGEAGGITQHIGAYQVELPSGKKITFLDTPGHEAFTAMRARGAQVTDIVILVVAADDSVMPQTIEAISHAKAANVPIVVAINKIDKPDANSDRIKQQLADHGVLIEEWGGKYQQVEISAKKGMHIDLLLEKIILEADLLNLTANPERGARGVVIESNMSKGLGSVATVIVQKGTLNIGDSFVAGVHSGKVRAMYDERGHKMEFAGPSAPVRVVGFDGLPEAGDSFFIVDNEVEARNISNERKQLKREQELRQVRHVTLDEISAQIKIGGVQELNLIIKGDVGGSVEAISDSLLKLSNDEVRVNILHSGVGPIIESDVMLAAASGAVVIGFNVSPSGAARRIADNEKIDIRLYSIIYDCINEVHLALEGLLKPDIKEEITSEVEIRRVYKISRLGTIAGCYVLSGKITRNDKIRLLRNGLPVFTGSIGSLKRNKDDVKEVDTSYECGIQLDGYNDIEEGDIIQGFKLVEVRRTLN